MFFFANHRNTRLTGYLLIMLSQVLPRNTEASKFKRLEVELKRRATENSYLI